MPAVTIRRYTEEGTRKDAWEIVEKTPDAPESLIVGVHGGYCGLWHANVDVPSDGGKLRSMDAEIVKMWTEPTGHGLEHTRCAIVSW